MANDRLPHRIATSPAQHRRTHRQTDGHTHTRARTHGACSDTHTHTHTQTPAHPPTSPPEASLPPPPPGRPWRLALSSPNRCAIPCGIRADTLAHERVALPSHAQFCKCRSCDFCASAKAAAAMSGPAPSVSVVSTQPVHKKKNKRQMESKDVSTAATALPLTTTSSSPHAKKACASGITGDFAYETCGAFCKPAKAANHCKCARMAALVDCSLRPHILIARAHMSPDRTRTHECTKGLAGTLATPMQVLQVQVVHILWRGRRDVAHLQVSRKQAVPTCCFAC